MEHRKVKKIILGGSFDAHTAANMEDVKILVMVVNDHYEALKEVAEQIDILEKEIEELKEAHNAN